MADQTERLLEQERAAATLEELTLENRDGALVQAEIPLERTEP